MDYNRFIEVYAEKLTEAEVAANRSVRRVSKSRAKDYCQAMLNALNECFNELEPDERLKFSGFGSFVKRRTGPRTVGGFVNGTTMEIPSYDAIRFARSRIRKHQDDSLDEDES